MSVKARLRGMVGRHGDVVLAVALVGLLVLQVWTLDVSTVDKLLTTAAGLVLVIPLACRVRMPLVLLAVLLGVILGGILLPKRISDVEAFGLIVLLAIYSGAAHTSRRRSVVAGALTFVIAVVVLLSDPGGVNFSGVIFFALLFGAPWLAGWVVRRRRLNEARLERERDAAEAAIVEERGRIARELHDVVAHAISVIVLQARGGRRLLETEPDETRQALDAIEHTGEQALTEMRRLVGLLRESDQALAMAPQPSLSRLDTLVTQVRAAGLPVELSVEGTPIELPPGVDLSAYRIVQEALTNALKHAGPTRARVNLRYEAEGLEVDVTDDGTGQTNGDDDGHGLVGIRERVTVYGGELTAGPRAEGGYAVRARLPYASQR